MAITPAKIIIGALALIFFVGYMVFVSSLGTEEVSDEAAVSKPATLEELPDEESGPVPPETITVHYEGVDLRDFRRLTAEAQNVWIGTVEEQVGDEPLKSSDPDDAGRPQIQYAVSVGDVMKSPDAGGSADEEALSRGDRLVVDQIGGYDPQTNDPLVVRADHDRGVLTDGPLEEGGRYLFCTVYDPARQMHVIYAQPSCNVALSNDEESRAVIRTYQNAVENPPPESSGQNGPEAES